MRQGGKAASGGQATSRDPSPAHCGSTACQRRASDPREPRGAGSSRRGPRTDASGVGISRLQFGPRRSQASLPLSAPYEKSVVSPVRDPNVPFLRPVSLQPH